MPKAANVSTGKPQKAGSVFVAVIGTTVPTDATTALPEAFKELGYCSEDGLTNSNSPESESVKAWGGDTVLDIQSSKPDTFQCKLIEVLNVDVLKTVYGADNVKVKEDGTIEVHANADEAVPYVWVIQMIMRNKTIKRIVVPEAKITELGDITYTDSDATGYEITLSCTPDANGDTHVEYIKPATTTTATTGE